MSGNGIGSTPPLSHNQFSTSTPDVNTTTPLHRSSSQRSQHAHEGMPSPRASQEEAGTEMRTISRQSSVATRPRRSLQEVQPAPGASSDAIERISAEDVERALDTIANEPLPPHVDSPASLWQHVTARLQAMLGGAVTAGITFGVFRGLGAIAEHTTSSDFGQQVAKQMQSLLIGGVIAGIGNTAAVMAVTPIAGALLSKALGSSAALVPENPEHMVPVGYPDRDAQIARIRTEQSKFTVDSLINIVSGVLSFGGLHAARAALTANADLSPVAAYAVAAATSFVAGGVTALGTQTIQANKRTTVQGPDGLETPLLFKPASNPPPAIGAAVGAAVKGFTGGRQGGTMARHVASQVAQRSGIVTGSTVVYGMTQAVIPKVREALIEHGQSPEEANRNAAAAMTAVGFATVVIAYFTLLGKIAGTLPQRNPPPVQEPAQESAAPATEPR